MLVGVPRALDTGVEAIIPPWPPLVVVVELFEVVPFVAPLELLSATPLLPLWFPSVLVPPVVLPIPVEVPDDPAVCKGAQAGTPDVPKEGSVPAGQLRVESELLPAELTPSEFANVLDPLVPLATVEEIVGVGTVVT